MRKLQGRLMPPPDKPQPDQAAGRQDGRASSRRSWMQRRRSIPNPGSVVMHRLNRTEYAREIKDLLGIKIDAAALLPKDTKSGWLRQRRDVLQGVAVVSRSVHRRRARRERAGDRQSDARRGSVRVSRRAGHHQEEHIEGLPLGTRGGMLVEHLFPADGDYTFNINQSGGFGGGYIAGLDSKQHADHDHRRQEGVTRRSSAARRI